MILDAENRFSNEQALTATAVSTNVIDLGTGDKGVNPMRLVITVDVEFDSAGDAGILTVTLQTDDNAAFSSAKSALVTGALAQAVLLAGAKVVDVAVPVGMERYARLNYVVTGADFSAGKLSAELVMDAPANTHYADARRFA